MSKPVFAIALLLLSPLSFAQTRAVDLIGPVPDPALYGPYAVLANKTYRWPDGSMTSWYISETGGSVVAEKRGPTGQIEDLHLVKSIGGGSLVMLRSGDCPDGVCGQTGTIKDGVLSWKQPKASGGHAGGYMDVKMWTETNTLITYVTDPAPQGGVQIYDKYPELEYLRPKPIAWPLEPLAAYTPEQMTESMDRIAALEPQIEAEVTKALVGQATVAQNFADDRAARQRSSERVRRFNQAMEGMNSALTAADEVATANEAQSRAELDATIAQMNAQAAMQRQQSSSGPAQAGPVASASSAPASETSADPTATTLSQPAAGNPANDDAAAAGQPLRFVMTISLRNLAGDKVNPTCYSNIITRPGVNGIPIGLGSRQAP